MWRIAAHRESTAKGGTGKHRSGGGSGIPALPFLPPFPVLSRSTLKGNFEHYQLWYVHYYAALEATVFDMMTLVIVEATLLAGWFTLLPLGILLLIIVRRRWSELHAGERWGTTVISTLAIVVPLLTWTASHQFLRWFLD